MQARSSSHCSNFAYIVYKHYMSARMNSGLTAFKEVPMEYENKYLVRLTGNLKGFSVEDFNIFVLGADHLPRLICVYPKGECAGGRA